MDTIVHMAAVNGTEFFYQQPELVLDVAVRGMLTVIDACRTNGIGDLVVASSSERSDEHTSELQSLMRNSYAVFCLKKKKPHRTKPHTQTHTLLTPTTSII